MYYIKKRLQHRCFPVKFSNFFRYLFWRTFPANIRLWWRRLEKVSRLRLQKTSWSRRTYSLYSYVFRRRFQDVFKTSWSRPIYSSWSYVFKTSSRHFQDVFKTPSRRFKDVFKTSSRHLKDVLQRCLQDAFKANHQVILFLLTSFQDIFKTYSQRFLGVLQRRLSTEGFALVTLLRNLLSVHKICKGDNSFSSFSFSLYCTF